MCLLLSTRAKSLAFLRAKVFLPELRQLDDLGELVDAFDTRLSLGDGLGSLDCALEVRSEDVPDRTGGRRPGSEMGTETLGLKNAVVGQW